MTYPVPVPVVGQEIYIPTRGSSSIGELDWKGGLATITEVEQRPSPVGLELFVQVNHQTWWWRNWSFLWEDQENLKKMFGESRARRDPDYRPEHNKPW